MSSASSLLIFFSIDSPLLSTYSKENHQSKQQMNECTELQMIDMQAPGSYFEFDFELLTLEIASVRFGGGSFGFPRPNNLFILLQNMSLNFLRLLIEKLLRSYFRCSSQTLQGCLIT